MAKMEHQLLMVAKDKVKEGKEKDRVKAEEFLHHNFQGTRDIIGIN